MEIDDFKKILTPKQLDDIEDLSLLNDITNILADKIIDDWLEKC